MAHEPADIPGWQHFYSGKVRDLYLPASTADVSGSSLIDDAELRAGSVLVVASDRISAFDHVLPTEIPDKGRILTQLSLWWCEQLKDVVPNHVLSTEVPEAVAGRAMICKSLSMFPVECIARGYLTGSGLAEYQRSGSLWGQSLPEGLQDGSRLAEAVFTPTGKADVGEHDEPITYDQMCEAVGRSMGDRLRELTLDLYTTAEQIAREQGIILADTKVEFGLDSYRGEVTLGDEVLTPDSSRFWDGAAWEPGRAQASFDKQFVRDWLTSPESGWDRASGEAPPSLPEKVVGKTRQRYVEAYERLTGERF